MDYEQKCYDLLYENRILKNKIKILEESLKSTNDGDLKLYLINEISRYKGSEVNER